MPLVGCKICKRSFYAKPSWLKLGFGKYCSSLCQRLGQRTGRTINCHICNKKTYRSGKELRHSKSKKYFCSKSCQTKWRNSQVYIGARHPNWKSGKFAYKTVLRRHNIPEVCRLCRTKDKRILATHHIDKNHLNDKLSNLAWLCHNCHYLVHHDKQAEKKFMEVLV